MQKTLYEVCRVGGAEDESTDLLSQQNCDDVGGAYCQDVGGESSITLPQSMLTTRLPSTSYVELYEKEMRDIGRAEGTIEKFRLSARHLMKVVVDKPIEKADSADIKDLVSHMRTRGCKNITICSNLSCLSSFYQFLQDEGVVDKNPVQRVLKKLPRPRASGCRHRILDVKEVRKMIECAMNARDRVVLLLLYKTGVRIGGLHGIDVDDVGMNRGEIFVREKKGDESGYTIFFDDETKYYLQKYLVLREMQQPTDKSLLLSNAGKRLAKRTIFDTVKKYAKKAGLMSEEGKENCREKSISPHTFRRTFTTHLQNSGARRDYVKELRGDVRGETIDIYTQITKDDLRKEYLRHIPQLGI